MTLACLSSLNHTRQLRNVFARLDVTTRTAAIVKAQERLHRKL